MTSTHGDHPKGLRFSHGSASVVGQVRAANEDSFVVTDRLVAVADGMGGHAAGEVASAIAVEVVAGAAEAHDVEVVTNAVVTANAQILERAMQDSSERGMGTTLCVAAIVADRGAEGIAILNVGDSRIYLLADDTLHQLTEDHSLVETLVREGRITPAEAAVHPQRNVLTRALGV
ncbi:MAG: serine/threonine-protein phosphatase, partial [Microthrixaceae bacterium]|nr:serine/threonine-protein phosphatase [Microthrixaceae bacterium]